MKVATLVVIFDSFMNLALKLTITKVKTTSMPKNNIEVAFVNASNNRNWELF